MKNKIKFADFSITGIKINILDSETGWYYSNGFYFELPEGAIAIGVYFIGGFTTGFTITRLANNHIILGCQKSITVNINRNIRVVYVMP